MNVQESHLKINSVKTMLKKKNEDMLPLFNALSKFIENMIFIESK